MKTFITILLSVSVFQATQCMTPEQEARMKAAIEECRAVTGVSEELVNKALGGNFADDPKLRQQVFCFSKKVGLQNEAGDILMDQAKEKLSAIVDTDKIDEIISKCMTQKATPEETAFEASKCISAIEHS